MTKADVQPSASIASTGLGIRYVGNYAYAYSGNIEADTAATTALEHTTGSGYIVGEFSFSGFLDQDSPGVGILGTCIISFNDQVVMSTKSDHDTGNQVAPSLLPVIIPPFTKVNAVLYASSQTSVYHATTSFTGRVYGAD